MAVAPGLESYEIPGMEALCCVDNCSDEGKEGSEPQSSDCGVCNPLFSCSCYCGFIITSQTFKLETVKSIESKNAVYSPSKPLQLSYSIWQPPKI